MIGVTFSIVVATVFFLAFASLRWFGLLGVALLIYIFPLESVALLVFASIAFYFIKHR